VSSNVWHFNPVAFLDVIKNGCSCDNDVTEVQLRACAAGNTAAEDYVDALNKAFKGFGITACINKAHFIAQTMVESANYSITKEISNSKQPHPKYWPYIGRGLIQLTGQKKLPELWSFG
jgi:predicted chitinase